MSHYNKDYFAWQKSVGAFGAIASMFKFAPFIRETDRILDFGCGGGYLLDNLRASEKMGIEINPAAIAEAQNKGLKVYESVNQVPDECATVVISNHALEHVDCPLDSLQSLFPKLAKGGKIIIVVPHQGPNESYKANDPNQHLYTWNPLTLGNMLKKAGYSNIQVDTIRHTWPPYYMQWYKYLGEVWFHRLCRIYSYYKGTYQIRGMAIRQ